MSKNNIWYLAGPFHQYQENVKALAKEAGLVIVDANAATSRKGEAKDVPEVTIRPELKAVAVVVEAGGLSQDVVEQLTAELAAIGVIVESFAAQALERPAGELGETGSRLFQVLEAVNAGIASLQGERDGEVEKAGKLQQENEHLRAEIAVLKQAAASDPEVEQLKAKLTEAGVTYRANASKESLQKQVDELAK
ncbi:MULTISPECIES: hypothetical protein [Pseudomonas]|uniref:hypothetical protein n=1 Tax=Pseudomonas TaxID=286 RepID=UPI0013DFE151|nr:MULTISPECIES: hypothetical protein [Pseudomonas]MCE0912063.1 hypothetical protein [Pseudomonas kurunegalensis]QIG17853.1 hypothetical protein FY041_08770 [Pseudomonas monteilii]QIG23110.1 hypothetical protein FY043_08765 [Pseudomonas monteilii]WJR57600.1 hypothetical protein LU664_008585 [Pseudomonas kurunegalensis]